MNRDTWGKPDPKPEKGPPKKPKPLRRVPVQRYSEKQVNIKVKLREAYQIMDEGWINDYQSEYVMCAAYPHQISHMSIVDHSHTISQDRCKKLGKPELIYDLGNIEYSCRKAHEEWDHYKPEFVNHANFERRMAFIKQHDPHDYERRMEIWAKVNKPKETV